MSLLREVADLSSLVAESVLAFAILIFHTYFWRMLHAYAIFSQ